jgi:hypothetical protein
VKDANLGLPFLIEVTALAIFACWGWRTENGAIRWAIASRLSPPQFVVRPLFV